jgi:DMSO reductase family type II enzyme chaperone
VAEQVVTAPVHERQLAQGWLYRQLGEGFAYPTTERLLAWQSGRATESLAEAINTLGSPELQIAFEQLEQSLEAGHVDATAAMASRPTLEEEYTYLFQRQTVASPYEGSYLVQSFFMQPQMLADVGAFYSAFGFRVTGDLQDHLGAELEFMAVLCFKELYAYEQVWIEQAATCAQARRRFLGEHLGRWLPVFAIRVRDHARLPFYAALTELTATLVALDCKALGVVPDQTGVFMPEPTQTAQVEQDDGMCAA